MKTKEELKTLINQKIYENTDGEITAANLNQVLNDVVETTLGRIGALETIIENLPSDSAPAEDPGNSQEGDGSATLQPMTDNLGRNQGGIVITKGITVGQAELLSFMEAYEDGRYIAIPLSTYNLDAADVDNYKKGLLNIHVTVPEDAFIFEDAGGDLRSSLKYYRTVRFGLELADIYSVMPLREFGESGGQQSVSIETLSSEGYKAFNISTIIIQSFNSALDISNIVRDCLPLWSMWLGCKTDCEIPRYVIHIPAFGASMESFNVFHNFGWFYVTDSYVAPMSWYVVPAGIKQIMMDIVIAAQNGEYSYEFMQYHGFEGADDFLGWDVLAPFTSIIEGGFDTVSQYCDYLRGLFEKLNPELVRNICSDAWGNGLLILGSSSDNWGGELPDTVGKEHWVRINGVDYDRGLAQFEATSEDTGYVYIRLSPFLGNNYIYIRAHIATETDAETGEEFVTCELFEKIAETEFPEYQPREEPDEEPISDEQ